MTIVHAHIFKPHNSIFKSGKAQKSECQTIDCSHSDQCGLFARGECAWIRILGWYKCPYGQYSTQTGYTTRARAYHKWINDHVKIYEGIDCLKGHTDVLAEIGDYIFLPYSHITMNENIPFNAHGGFLRTGSCFLHKDAFTIDNIIAICEFKPQAVLGGEIKTYQEKEVPKFLMHLYEQMPGTFKQLCKKYSRAKTIFENRDYTNREVLIYTITPNVGKFKDIHGGEWKWDGTYLTSYNSHSSFLLIGCNEYSELRIKPTAKAVIKVTDNRQVNKDTKFLS